MKLIDDSSSLRSSKIAIDSDSLLNWIAENKVLSIALEGKAYLFVLIFSFLIKVSSVY